MAYSMCLIFNMAINLFPIIDILNSLRDRFSAPDVDFGRGDDGAAAEDKMAPHWRAVSVF